MPENAQGLIVLAEGERFVTVGRSKRARVWRVDPSGQPVEDGNRTRTAPPDPPRLVIETELVESL